MFPKQNNLLFEEGEFVKEQTGGSFVFNPDDIEKKMTFLRLALPLLNQWCFTGEHGIGYYYQACYAFDGYWAGKQRPAGF